MLLLLLILLLFSNALSVRRDISILLSRVVITSLIYTSEIAYSNLYLKPLESGLSIYGGLFNITILSQSFNIFIILISAVILTLTAFYPRKVYIPKRSGIYNILIKKIYYNKDIISKKNSEQFKIIEYSLIIVFILSGGIFLISSADLISIFLSIELQSYGLYILSTIYRDSESATSSALIYFLLGGLSSCFILLGSALLYINSGTTNLDNIYIITNVSEIKNFPLMFMYEPYYFNLALIIMFVGLLFKVSAAPFHFWSPDVYDGIPTIVTTYVAIIAKISLFIFFLEIVHYTDYAFSYFNWKNILILSSFFSLVIGSLLGLTQWRIKRLFAYSTISHVGFILLALSMNSTESIQSYIFYIIQYTISNLNAFIILITIGYSFYSYVNKESSRTEKSPSDNYSPVQFLNQLKGYFHVNSFLAISLTITLFSFVGIPPLMGFFAKQMVLSAAIDSGYVFMALLAILTSVIAAAYYLNIIKQIFFYESDFVIKSRPENIKVKTNYVRNFIFDTLEEDYDRLLDIVMSGEEDIYDYVFRPSMDSEDNLQDILIDGYLNKSNITVNSSLSTSISVLTLLLLLFISVPNEWFNIVSVLTLILFRS